MFRNAKVGDKVWSILHGWGEVSKIFSFSEEPYPVEVKFPLFDDTLETFTVDGRGYPKDLNPTLFWDEVKIVPPPEPVQPMTQAEYLAEPSRCPYCRGFNIAGDTVEVDCNTAQRLKAAVRATGRPLKKAAPRGRLA